jgi:CRP-like cAMP-binding protein
MTDAHQALLLKVRKVVDIKPAEESHLVEAFRPLKKKKNELLIKKGDRVENLFFVAIGFVRLFDVDESGNENTKQLASRLDLISSFESFLNGEPATENLQCISACTLLTISKEDYKNLYQHVREWPAFCRSVYEDSILKMSRWIQDLQSKTAEERYEQLIETQADMALHVPVKYLASYLGIRPQSLSRIRNGQKSES